MRTQSAEPYRELRVVELVLEAQGDEYVCHQTGAHRRDCRCHRRRTACSGHGSDAITPTFSNEPTCSDETGNQHTGNWAAGYAFDGAKREEGGSPSRGRPIGRSNRQVVGRH